MWFLSSIHTVFWWRYERLLWNNATARSTDSSMGFECKEPAILSVVFCTEIHNIFQNVKNTNLEVWNRVFLARRSRAKCRILPCETFGSRAKLARETPCGYHWFQSRWFRYHRVAICTESINSVYCVVSSRMTMHMEGISNQWFK